MAKNDVRINDLKQVFKSNMGFFALALFTNILLINCATMSAYYGIFGKLAKENFENVLFSFTGLNQWGAVAVIITSAIFPMIFAWKMFRFVNNKKASNVYMSVGVMRKDLFVNRFIAMASMIAVVVALPILIGVIWNLSVFGTSSALFESALFVALRLFFASLANFAITAVVIVSVGTKTEEFAISTIFVFALTVLEYFLNTMQKLFFYGFGYKYIGLITSDFRNLSAAGDGNAVGNVGRFNNFPITDFEVLSRHMDGDKGAGRATFDYTALLVLILIVVFFLYLAYTKFLKRKTEVIGFYGVSTGSNIVLTAIVAMLTALIAGDFLVAKISYGALGNVGTTKIIILFAVALTTIYLIFMAILMHNMKAFMKKIWKAPIFTVVLMIPAIVMVTGGFGASDRIPQVGEIKSASISLPIDASIMPLGKSFPVSQFISITGSTDFSYTGFTSLNDIEQIRKIHEKLINLKGKATSRTRPYMDKMFIAYELNDGSVIQRAYDYFDKETATEWLKIIDSDFLKNQYIDSYNNTEPMDDKAVSELAKSYPKDSRFFLLNNAVNSNLNGKMLRIYGAERTATGINMNEFQILKFRKAIAEDLGKVPLTEIYLSSKRELGVIQFCDAEFFGDTNIIELPIVEEMENTLEYLQKFDFFAKQQKPVRPLYATVFELKNFLSNNTAHSSMNAGYYLNSVKKSFVSEEYSNFLIALERCKCAYFETDSEDEIAKLRNVSLSNQFTYNEGYVVVYRYADYTQRAEYIPYEKIPNGLKPQ